MFFEPPADLSAIALPELSGSEATAEGRRWKFTRLWRAAGHVPRHGASRTGISVDTPFRAPLYSSAALLDRVPTVSVGRESCSATPSGCDVKIPKATFALASLLAAAHLASAAEPQAQAPAVPTLQITGRVIHTWYDEDGLRVIVVIDGFTVLSADEQLTARDGVVWFDEAAARASGHAELGIYAETQVEFRRASGDVEKYDSAYLVMSDGAEISLAAEEGRLRGKADATPLYLRAKKRRREFLEAGVSEAPSAVVKAPEPVEPPPAPGVREAAVPREITIVPQDDVRTVNFTSFVEDGTRVSIWTGGVYVQRGDMEMAADNIVIWTPEQANQQAGAEDLVGALRGPSRRLAAEAYFEGHVTINTGRRTIRATQVYYDFQRDEALILDAKIKTFAPNREIPVYYYAKEVRQLSRGIFASDDAWMTTCEFAHPHYEMGATKLTLVDLTPEPAPGEEALPPDVGQEKTYHRVRFVGDNVQVRVRHVPVTYWPRLAGDLEEGETALRTIRIENSTNRGTGVVSQWHLFKLLGLEEKPPGYNFYLDADYWSERGPGIGVEGKYRREDYYGQFLSYYLGDSGKDSIGQTDVEPAHQDRGRVLWRHRQYLAEHWELTGELAWISDPTFLNEFYEYEDETQKAQETLIYLKRQEGDQALTLLGSWRLNDFYTRTEYQPQVGYNMIGRSLLDDHLTYFQDTEVDYARYRPREVDPLVEEPMRGSDGELVADSVHELDLPLRFGPVGIVPFVLGRPSYFEEDFDHDGDRWRGYFQAGARAAMQAWRVYPDVESNFWNVHGIRHIQTYDARAFTAGTNVRSRDLIPYDVTEAGTPIVQGVDDTGAVELGWRNRFQTKRGLLDKRETVDWLTMDLEGFFYHNREGPGIAPDGRLALNHLELHNQWRTTDSLSLWTDTNYEVDDGTLDLFAVGMTVSQTPRFTYSVGHRYIPDGTSAQTFLSFDYRINEKYQLSLLEIYDFDRQLNAQSNFTLTRRLHRWLMRVKVELDPGENDKFFGIELQPMGVSEVRMGM